MGKSRLQPVKQTEGRRVGTRDSEAVSSDGLPPAFCFDHTALGYSIDDCDRDDRAALATHIWRMSRLTWRELRSSQRHGLGGEKIHTVNRVFPRTVTEDVTLLAYRFSGMKAMVGFREGRIFHIVWLDHDFTVYDH